MNPITIAATFAMLGIGLGAFGAHALREALAASGHVSTWNTAIQYHLVHALAICVIGVWLRLEERAATSGLIRASVWLWGAGIVLFSGSLYGLALGLPRWLGPVTPLGGVCFIAGWVALALGSLRLERRP